MLYVILIDVIKEQTLGITWIIQKYLSDQERLFTLGELDKYSICSQIVLTKKSLVKVEWDLKKV